MNAFSQRLMRDAKAFGLQHQQKWPYAAAFLICLIIYGFSRSNDETTVVYKTDRTPDFKDARILNDRGDTIYEGKERLLAKTIRELKESQTSLKESFEKMQSKLDDIEKTRPNPEASDLGTEATQVATGPNPASSPDPNAPVPPSDPKALLAKDPVRFGPGADLPVTTGGSDASSPIIKYEVPVPRRARIEANVISFPVKEIRIERSEGIALPPGSYVKAKLMTGVEAPEGRTYPVLLQLDFAYIVPNHKKLDLSGCFMIAKSQGDLSTERVQMQATKLSCVSKSGRMFEKDVNGF